MSQPPPEPVKTFHVTGAALVPVQVSIRLEAVSPEAAITKAAEMWKDRNDRQRMIVPGSADESCAFDFEPSEAIEP